ncbi:MAG: acylphosphatase [Methanomicrobiales archaeon]|nr:acylphosphatase [Methanomicrobiales archaeon]
MLYVNDDTGGEEKERRGKDYYRYQATKTPGEGVEDQTWDERVPARKSGRLSVPEQKTIQIRISGKVQRVGMRNCIRSLASRLNIRGEVMNMPDGTVLAIATSDPILLEKFVSMIYACPRAVIRDIEILDHPLTQFMDFQVRRIEP